MKHQISDNVKLLIKKIAYVARNKEPIITKGVIRTASLPMPMSAVIARIWHGIWMVNKYISRPEDEQFIEFSAAKGKKLVHFHLGENESLSFKIRHAILWTDEIKFQQKSVYLLRTLLAKQLFTKLRPVQAT